MIDQTVALITFSFIFLIVLLLIGTIHSKLHWGFKSVFILSSILVIGIIYKSFNDDLGWPVATHVPEKFEFLAAVINEPTKTDSGSIYLWYSTKENSIPRSIKIPYSKNSHKKIVEAEQGKGEGKRQFMKSNRPPGNSQDPNGNPADGPLEFLPDSDPIAPK